MRRLASAAVLVVCAAGGLALLLASSPRLVWLAAGRVASFAEVRARDRSSDVRLLDRTGELLHEQRADPARRKLEWVPLEAVSPELVRAVIGSEDRRFERHGGVDGLALAASLAGRMSGAARRGASTITMQLAALLGAAPRGRGAHRSALEKWRQMRTAWAIEGTWTKPEILEAYLNLVAFRGELTGIAAASYLLLGKAPHALSTSEAVVLAASIRGPNASRPVLERRATGLARALAATQRSGPPRSAPPAEIALAIEHALDPERPSAPRVALAPHVAARLLPTMGGAPAVRTTLDATVQRAAVDILGRAIGALAGRNAHDGAALVVDNASGEILAYVGSSGALASARHVDGVRAHRQAGSTLKPLLYALALDERRLTAASPLVDEPLALTVAGGIYRPRNYDERFRGLVTLRAALAGSLNVPAVRTLEIVGVDAFAAVLRQLGFDGIDRPGDHYGPALALGSADVSLAELVNAYRAIANGGAWSPLRPLSLDDPQATAGASAAGASASAAGAAGTGVAAPSAAQPRRVYSPEAAFVIADVLSDRESRSATFGLESPLATRFWAAVKTGTSKDMRDNWCIGFSRRYTVGVWVGNFSGEPMHDVSGVSGAAPAWLEMMTFLHRGRGDERPDPPADLVRRTIELPPEPARDEWFLAGTEPGASRVAIAEPRARIASPTEGGLFAIDPDIPPANQRMALVAEGARSGTRWRIDGRDLGDAARSLLWPPTQGRHRLALVGPGGSALDEVAFEVRSPGR